MSDILGSNLVDKPVMQTDGRELGTLYQVTVNLRTGELVDIIVDPDGHFSEYDVDENGYYRIGIDRVQAIRDYVIVD